MMHAGDGIGRFAAILADLDGTLVDTMPLQHLAYQRTLARYGGELTRGDYDAIVGPPARETIPKFGEAAGLDPARLPFLKAAELVGAAPAECLVLEDHPAGIAAAQAAGMAVMDVRGLPAQGGWSW